MMNKTHKNKTYNGMIALTTLLVVSFVLIAGVITITLTSVDLAKNTKGYYSHNLAKFYSTSCFEEALLLIRNDSNYTGEFSLTAQEAHCTAQVKDGIVPNQKVIEVESDYDNYIFSDVIEVMYADILEIN